MTFLNFGALFGLAAISIPIIIHLLNQFQVQEVKWAAMRFLEESIQKNQRRLQLEDLILMLLRCLLIALLILALSRPTWQSGAKTSGSHQVEAVIIIDDSYSMGLTNGITTSLQRAQTAAEQVLAAFPTGSSSALFFAADNVEPVIAQPTYDFSLLRQRIRQAKLTDRTTDLSNAVQLAVTTLQKHETATSKEIYLITDGQANGWPSLDTLEKQLADVQKQITVHLVLVGDAAESNLGVTDLRLDGGLTPVNQPLRCAIQVFNGSGTEARDVRVSLMVDSDPAVDEKTIDSIPAGAARSVALFAKLRTEGYHTLTAQIPHDRLPADDQRTLAVRTVREVKVLLVDGSPEKSPTEADDFFVRNALAPVAASELPNYFVKTTTITASQLSTTPLDDYDAVFFLDVDQVDSTLAAALTKYVVQGGGLVIFPGPSCNIDSFNQTLGQDGFLPAHIGPYTGDTDRTHEDKFFTLQTKDYDHPIVSLWNDSSAGTLASSHFYAYYTLAPTPWKSPAPGEPTPTGGQPRVVLHFAQNSDPAMIEHTWGSGRVILFASTPTRDWNDLPVHDAFVPLMQRVLGALVERETEGLNVRVGQNFSFVVPNELLHKDVSVTVPNQTDPARVDSQVALVNGLPVVQYADTDFAGAYHVSIASDPPTPIAFAAQSDPNESNLTLLSPEQLKTLGDAVDVIKWTPDVSLTPKLTSARVGRELWFPLMISALILAVLEVFLAQSFSKSK
jgi:Mg-chelatase subunit ChlD